MLKNHFKVTTNREIHMIYELFSFLRYHYFHNYKNHRLFYVVVNCSKTNLCWETLVLNFTNIFQIFAMYYISILFNYSLCFLIMDYQYIISMDWCLVFCFCFFFNTYYEDAYEKFYINC